MKAPTILLFAFVLVAEIANLTSKYLLVRVDDDFRKPKFTYKGLSKMAEEIASGGEKSCSSNKDCPDEGFQCVQLGEVGMCECVHFDKCGAGCFHGSNKVTLENGEKRLISDLKTEDSVLVMNDAGGLHFSPVILQMQQSPNQKSEFRTIRTTMGHSLTLTPNHLIYTGEFPSIQAVFASNVKIGDYVPVKDGKNGMKADKVVAVDTISLTGLYSPLTEQGNIVVENILASCYSDFENHKLQHLAFTPFRWYNHARNLIYSKATTEHEGKYPMEGAGMEINSKHWYGEGLAAAAKNLVPERMTW